VVATGGLDTSTSVETLTPGGFWRKQAETDQK
jgi:hypothetical protein